MGMTVQQLADKTNLDADRLIQLERDEVEHPVDADVLLKIAVALETTIADLLGLPVRCMRNGKFFWRMPQSTN